MGSRNHVTSEMTSWLAAARRVVDGAWSIYDGSPSESRARAALMAKAADAVCLRNGLALTEEDVAALTAEGVAARRNQVMLTRLRRENDARHAATQDASTELEAWGANVAARQAGDWLRFVDNLLTSLCRYETVDGDEAGPASRRRGAQRFARRCASELGIPTPTVRWIRPVPEGGDFLTIGQIAGCAPAHDRSVVYVRNDICSDLERLRVVAHEVAHHCGFEEHEALAYERAAVRRHTPRRMPLHLSPA
jgi:hypothetical protein